MVASRNDVVLSRLDMARSLPRFLKEVAMASPSVNDKRNSAKAIAEDGVFNSFSGTVPHAELNAFFRDDLPKRSNQ
jgi:hypothetical protein